MTLLLAALANFWGSKLVVESELARPFREAVARWYWIRYLSQCWACVGTWIAIAEVLCLGDLIGRGLAGGVVSVLAVAAGGHLVLELRGPFVR